MGSTKNKCGWVWTQSWGRPLQQALPVMSELLSSHPESKEVGVSMSIIGSSPEASQVLGVASERVPVSGCEMPTWGAAGEETRMGRGHGGCKAARQQGRKAPKHQAERWGGGMWKGPREAGTG